MIDIVESLNKNGWCKISNLYNQSYIKYAKKTIDSLSPVYSKIQYDAKLLSETQNCLHHICVMFPELVPKSFPPKLMLLLTEYFNGKFILNAFGSTGLMPNGKTYTQKFHRDARDINSSRDMLNLIILLDDSSVENGATKLLEDSHLNDSQYSDEYFDKNVINIDGSAGDLIMLNPYIWHSTGQNTTNNSRTIITPMVTRPYIKPQMDYIRAIEKQCGVDYFKNCSDEVRQLFGMYSRIPSSLKEFYVPKEKRLFRSDQV